MITVVSLNSAIDKRIVVDRLVPGTLVRTRQVDEHAGGKGLNVAGAASELGRRVTVVGFAPGSRGRILRDAVRRKGIASRWIAIPGETRTNLAIFSNGHVTEILEPGPRVPARAAVEILRVVRRLARRSSVVVMSGSLPPGLGENFYARLIRACGRTFTILDTSGSALKSGVKAGPSLVRINEEEARQLDRLPETVVISMGDRGARFVHRGRSGKIRVPKLKAVNPIGAGDCMAGGIAAALDAGRSLEEALALGAACGAASVLTPETARVRGKDARALLREVSIRWD